MRFLIKKSKKFIVPLKKSENVCKNPLQREERLYQGVLACKYQHGTVLILKRVFRL
jgi:hypothetical protein